MIVSLNWLKKYTTIDVSVSELTTLIGERLVEIESVTDLGTWYSGIVIARVETVEKHPDADKLNVVTIDDGGVTKDIERLENSHIQVVCGAPNVRKGMMVAWMPPGGILPSTASDPQPVVLKARELRGVISNGMLASGKELVINNEHDGILEIEGNFEVGTSFAKAYELNDYLFDIENKSLTHRPDCFGLIGFAREVSAIMGQPFKSPDWLFALDPKLVEAQTVEGVSEPKVTIADDGLCPRYEAVVVKGVDSVKPSPHIIQSYLKRLGVRPISAAVDVTNYLMITTSHPLHAFDYDAFLRIQNDGKEPKIIVRAAIEGEKLTLLDGRTVTLSHDDILICAGEQPVGLAGAMGGAETEVTSTTKNILLESATFNLYNLRNTSMRHGIFSDAVTRFTKGQPALQTAPVLASAVRMLCDITGGTRASQIIDSFPGRAEPNAVSVSLTQINQILGSSLTMEKVKETLINIEMTIRPIDDDSLLVMPPYWRADLHISEDIVEEIGRINGFDTLEALLPSRPYTAVMQNQFDIVRSSVRSQLVRMGANEVLTYNFVPAKLFQRALQNPEFAFKIVNALSPELQLYRTSLTPSLLDKVHQNIKLGYDRFALFEMNKVHIKGAVDPVEPELPYEHPRLSLVLAATDKAAQVLYGGASYYQAKHFLDGILQKLHINYSLQPLSDLSPTTDVVVQSLIAPYEPKRSAVITASEGKVIGVIGEYKKSVSEAFKLPVWCAGFELATDELFNVASIKPSYEPLSKFPGTEQDICLRVESDITYIQLLSIVTGALESQPYSSSVQPIDIYQKEGDNEYMQITFRISLNNPDATMTTEAASKAIDRVVDVAENSLKAERI